jgi:uncharacterized protein YcbX
VKDAGARIASTEALGSANMKAGRCCNGAQAGGAMSARVAGIFRYPVKSMQGEPLEAAVLGRDGIPGDRAWGVRDEARGDFFVGKRSAALMACRAWYEAQEVGSEAVPWIELPDGESLRSDDPIAALRIGDLVGREVTVWPASLEARHAEPRDGRSLEDEMRELMGREAGEPMPDFSEPSPELLEVYARGGPFFDAFPLLLLTTRSLQSIANASPQSHIDARRFRPSLLLETDEEGPFPEQRWIGKDLRVGSARLRVQSTCARCVMTTHGFLDLPKDPQVMRTLVRVADGNLGVYATVEGAGAVERGAVVEVLHHEE